jgi:hypothetical protein
LAPTLTDCPTAGVMVENTAAMPTTVDTIESFLTIF